MRSAYKMLVTKSEGERDLGDLGIGGRNGVWGCGLDEDKSPVAGSCEHSN